MKISQLIEEKLTSKHAPQEPIKIKEMGGIYQNNTIKSIINKIQ